MPHFFELERHVQLALCLVVQRAVRVARLLAYPLDMRDILRKQFCEILLRYRVVQLAVLATAPLRSVLRVSALRSARVATQ